jgi:uncharacterized protein YjbJ (UPF0337 family)
MGFLDKLLGRGKKAAGEAIDKPEMVREGAHQEAEGAAKERAARAEAEAQAERDRAAEHRAERDKLD